LWIFIAMILSGVQIHAKGIVQETLNWDDSIQCGASCWCSWSSSQSKCKPCLVEHPLSTVSVGISKDYVPKKANWSSKSCQTYEEMILGKRVNK
jgi:hypothetical protein